jgi:hypothetical protein
LSLIGAKVNFTFCIYVMLNFSSPGKILPDFPSQKFAQFVLDNSFLKKYNHETVNRGR